MRLAGSGSHGRWDRDHKAQREVLVIETRDQYLKYSNPEYSLETPIEKVDLEMDQRKNLSGRWVSG